MQQALNEPQDATATGRLFLALCPDETARAGQPLLSDAQIRELLDRREALISYFASLADAYGRDRVIVFD